MQLTNEEMETLNRSTEILSRFVATGVIKKESFDLFEQMVVSVIDSPEDTGEIKYRTFDTAPFSRLILPYMVGFYQGEDNACFLTDVNILNLSICDDLLRFQLTNGEESINFSQIKEFSIAPALVITVDNDNKILFREWEKFPEEHNHKRKCETVNAPFLDSSPIVFECSVEKYEHLLSSSVTAKIHRVSVFESAIDHTGIFDICKVWARMKWKEQNN